MKKIFLLLLVAGTQRSAQNKTAEKFAATITPEELKEKLSVIASADMEGRETATEGQRKAAAYIEAYFKKLKLLLGFLVGFLARFLKELIKINYFFSAFFF